MTDISPTIIWACIGVALIILEVFTTTFFLLFFGIAGLFVAVARLIGLDSTPAEIILFAVAGIAGTLIFRNKFIKSFQSTAEVKIDKEKIIKITEDIPAKTTGSIIYRGVPWKAINDSEYDLNTGDSAVIDKIDGIKLILKQK